MDFINAFNHPFFRMGRLEDSGEIFALPNEATITNNEYDTWRNFDPANRPARTTPEGAAKLAQINALVTGSRVPGTQTLPRDFFKVQLPNGFFSRNANSFDIGTLDGVEALSDAASLHAGPMGLPEVSGSRSAYTPRFIQVALKLYFRWGGP